MKLGNFLVLALALGSITHTAKGNEETVDVSPKTFFAPVGFDDNDTASIVIDGYLPDTCHRVRTPEVKIIESERTIMIQPRAAKLAGPCMDVTVPYDTVVNLGVLPEGIYTIHTRDGATREQLEVKRASAGTIDEYLYAPIDSIQIENRDVIKFSAVLKGRFTNTCLKIKEIKVINSGKTVETLPIMEWLEKAESGTACESTETEFKRRIKLPQLSAGRHLVHVRSLNGQAINAVFTNLWQ